MRHHICDRLALLPKTGIYTAQLSQDQFIFRLAFLRREPMALLRDTGPSDSLHNRLAVRGTWRVDCSLPTRRPTDDYARMCGVDRLYLHTRRTQGVAIHSPASPSATCTSRQIVGRLES